MLTPRSGKRNRRDKHTKKPYEWLIRYAWESRAPIAERSISPKWAPLRAYIDFVRLHKENPLGLRCEALVISERARAASLLEALSEAGVDIREGVDPVLLESERASHRRLDSAGSAPPKRGCERQHNERGRSRSLRKKSLNSPRSFRTCRRRYVRKSPRYSALAQPVRSSSARFKNSSILKRCCWSIHWVMSEYLWVWFHQIRFKVSITQAF